MKEDNTTISQCLSILKEWAPGWEPSIFWTDNDGAELLAIANTFPGALNLLCDFHLKQGWNKELRCISGTFNI